MQLAHLAETMLERQPSVLVVRRHAKVWRLSLRQMRHASAVRQRLDRRQDWLLHARLCETDDYCAASHDRGATVQRLDQLETLHVDRLLVVRRPAKVWRLPLR